MTDKSDTRHLRDLLHLSPTGQRIHHWSGLDRQKDTDELTRTIAAAIPGLCNRVGPIARLEQGQLIPVNFAAFRKLVDKHICYARAVNRGAGWNGNTRRTNSRQPAGLMRRCQGHSRHLTRANQTSGYWTRSTGPN